ncbi:MAG: acyl-CoA/acyl-ACP dehydrogenase [SAR86 cluster bacterium]|nr:acyl-CoA/acyl-ACP dehydrogenase [SAR86 cluster bacterium]
MDFRFTDQQVAFRDTVKSFFKDMASSNSIRALWKDTKGFDDNRWKILKDLGVIGMLIEEEEGGLGLNDVDFVLIAEEAGYAALPEPLVDVGWITASLLKELPNNYKENWKAKLANGDLIALTGYELNKFLPSAHLADIFFLQSGDGLHFLHQEEVKLTKRESLDPSLRLYSLDWAPKDSQRLVHRSESADIWLKISNIGALSIAAQQLGLARKVIDMAVDYVKTREQFGKPIGSFQAIKHLLADVQVQIEFAKPVVYRAAYSLAHNLPGRYRDVSHAKLSASRTARLAAKNSIQAHGALGYTWESDLQIYMKRIWVLDIMWGNHSWHQNRLEEEILNTRSELGLGQTFI